MAEHPPKMNYAETIIRLVEEYFVTLHDFEVLNGNRSIDKNVLSVVLNEKIQRGIIDPQAYCLLLGHDDQKYVRLMKEFLRTSADQWGDDANEVIKYFGIYLLLHNGDSHLIGKLKLGNALSRFVIHQVGTVKTVHVCAMHFIFSFLYVLAAITYQISKKFHDAGQEQQVKLIKLYTAKDRFTMIIASAFNTAVQRLPDSKADTRNVMKNANKFIVRHNKEFISAEDLFKRTYEL